MGAASSSSSGAKRFPVLATSAAVPVRTLPTPLRSVVSCVVMYFFFRLRYENELSRTKKRMRALLFCVYAW